MGPGPSVAGEGQGGSRPTRPPRTASSSSQATFERMKEREYLGGMKRTPEQMQRLCPRAARVHRGQGRCRPSPAPRSSNPSGRTRGPR